MTATRAQIVAEARRWIGTPWHHNEQTRGLGCDCAGLMRGVMIGVGLMPADLSEWPNASQWKNYRARPDGTLMECLELYMGYRVSRTNMQAGDAVVLTIDAEPQHLGILAENKYGTQTIIHAVSDRRYMRVVEQRLMFSRRQRFAGAFTFPGIA